MKPDVLHKTLFSESETVMEKPVTLVTMATVTFQNGCKFPFELV